MAKSEIKNKMNIGSSSLILIFIVLCLTTFGLLSLSGAKNDLNLAERNAASVKEYYRADREAEAFCAKVDQTLLEAEKSGTGQVIEQQLGQYYDAGRDVIQTDIPMSKGQAMHVELGLDQAGEERYKVSAWYVYNQEDYEIDDSVPVWTGQ